MVLTARKGLRSGGFGRIPAKCAWDYGSGSDPTPMSGHGAYHCAVAIFGSRAPLNDELEE
jgi:hypothetical protein